MINFNQIQPRIITIISCTVIAILLLYASSVYEFISSVLHREGSSHSLIVPFLSGYFIWLKKDEIKSIIPRSDFIGIPLILIGVISPFFINISYQLNILILLIFISGLIITILGLNYFKKVAFPLFFLIAMIPIPQNFYTILAEHIREITFGVSTWFIAKLGIPFYREGTFLHLTNAVLRVNEGCSGIRYLISYFFIGVGYSYLFRNTNFNRFLLVILTIPISIFASVIRLSVIFILAYMFGPQMAEYWPHVFISWIIFFIILIFLIFIDLFFKTKYKQFSLKNIFPYPSVT